VRIVLDTNVFVSAVFFGGPPGRILEPVADDLAEAHGSFARGEQRPDSDLDLLGSRSTPSAQPVARSVTVSGSSTRWEASRTSSETRLPSAS
jgi:hypothetical protein